ncbi:MAG TPA: hypothetical protein VMY39_04935 [Planctomycetota bacterium]|nr:hypothetical protein [Planctomycetota bacterium]
MKRSGVMLLLVAGLCTATLAAPVPARKPVSKKSSRKVVLQEPETLRELKADEVAAGMRVKLVLKYGRPMIGTVTRANDREITLDMSFEAEGLSADFRFKRADVVKASELARQTDDERQTVQSHRSQVIRRIKVETSEEYAKRRAESRTEEEKQAEAAKALETVIASKQEERMRALLEEFPPTEWSEAKFN